MRGRRLSALISAALVAVAVAGCGGGDELAPEVPGPPADVVLPSGTIEPAAGTDEEGGDAQTDDSTTDDTGTTDEGTGSTDGTTDTGTTDGTTGTTPDTSGGSTAPEAAEDSPTNDTPPPEGSDAQQFEDFCEQNEGAC